MEKRMFLVHFFIGLFCVFNTSAQDNNETDYAILYMKRFGYIESTTDHPTQEQFERGLRLLQSFAGIPKTGILDKNTKKVMYSPRCGLRDPMCSTEVTSCNGSDNGQPYRKLGSWWKQEINYFTLNSTEKMKETTIKDLLRKAFDKWQKVSGLIINEVRLQSEADIVIAFYSGRHTNDDWHQSFDEPFRIIGHATIPNKTTYPCMIHFNEEETWMDPKPHESSCKGVHFFDAAIHEIGHALGLGHTCCSGSVMRPHMRYHEQKVELGYIDTLAMYDLYASNEEFEDSDITEPNPTDFPPEPYGHFCEGGIDAAFSRFDELYIFKGKVVWRLWRTYMILGDRPFWIRELFHFPHEIEKIDAAYRRPTDGRIIFFTGNRYWIFDDIYPFVNHSLPITDFGFSDDIHSIDAAVSSGKSGITYFFKGNQYWSYNEDRRNMENPNPLPMERDGFPSNIDAAATLTEGSSYVFKNKVRLKLNSSGLFDTSSEPNLIDKILECESRFSGR